MLGLIHMLTSMNILQTLLTERQYNITVIGILEFRLLEKKTVLWTFFIEILIFNHNTPVVLSTVNNYNK